LAKLNRHPEALAAFQAAIVTSHASFPMMQALSYRELATYAAAPSDVAAQASADMEAKLAEFDGRVTRIEFDDLYTYV
jgi:hypothetical protein